jgi:hypothetical protein
MPVGTLATADAILKDLYRGPIIEQINYKTYMLDKIERDSDNHGHARPARGSCPVESYGNESPTSMHRRRHARQPAGRGEQDAIAAIRYHDGAVELTDQLIQQAVGNNAGSFVNKLDRETTTSASRCARTSTARSSGTAPA